MKTRVLTKILLSIGMIGLWAIAPISLFAQETGDGTEPLYRRFQPATTTRTREDIEWSITYTFATNDATRPRVLLIGDSICNQYQSRVQKGVEGKINVTYWVSSKCVTDPDYFRELDLVLSANHYDLITFNNTLHSLGSDRGEWKYAYAQVVAFIRAKVPEASLFLVTGTPVEDPESSEKSREMGDYIKKVAERESLPVIDLYDVADKMDHEGLWSDGVHFNTPAIDAFGELISGVLLKAIDNEKE